MNEPVDSEKLQYLPHLDDVSEIFTFDPFPLYSIETQYKRVLKTDLPKYIGLNIFGLSFNKENQAVVQESSEFTSFKKGYFNPKTNLLTIEKIKNHFKKHPNKYYEIAEKNKNAKRLQ